MAKIPSRLSVKLQGPRGLLAAVLVLATRDVGNPNEPDLYIDAWDYLNSDQYSHHLELLGLESDMVPTMITDMPIEQIAKGTHVISQRVRRDILKMKESVKE